MNLLKKIFLGLFLIQFVLIGFSESNEYDLSNYEVQNDISVTTIYDTSHNYLIFMLIFGFTVICVTTMGLVMREYNLSQNKIE